MHAEHLARGPDDVGAVVVSASIPSSCPSPRRSQKEPAGTDVQGQLAGEPAHASERGTLGILGAPPHASRSYGVWKISGRRHSATPHRAASRRNASARARF